jgi:hypothetical protein
MAGVRVASMGTLLKPITEFAKLLAADAAFAILFGVIIAFILASLSAAGVITMTLAKTF